MSEHHQIIEQKGVQNAMGMKVFRKVAENVEARREIGCRCGHCGGCPLVIATVLLEQGVLELVCASCGNGVSAIKIAEE